MSALTVVAVITLCAWCGTIFLERVAGPRLPRTGPPIPDPARPELGPQPEPWRYGIFRGVIGAGAALLINYAVGGSLAESGFVPLAVTAFAAGIVSAHITRGIIIVGGVTGSTNKQ